MNYLLIFLLLISSYLLGSFPSGYILVKYVKKTDIRTEGSKNTGATNTTRILGAKYGFIALLIDAIKGIIIMSILIIFQLEQLYIVNGINLLAIYGLFAVLGHVFPVFLNFRGGKAVATSFGVLMFLTPLIGLVAVLIFIVTTILTKYISLSSIIASSSAVVISLLLAIFKFDKIKYIANPKLNTVPLSYALVILVLGLIIVIKHKDNIKRLIDKNENKFSLKKPQN